MQGIRFSLAGGLLLGWLLITGAPRPTWRQIRNAALIGVLLLNAGLGLVTLAEHEGVGSGLAATMIAISPVWLALWGRIWGVWPRRREWLGMGVGFLAVLVLAVGGDVGASWTGFVLLLLSPLAWTFGSALSGRIDMPTGAMASAWEMVAAAVVFWLLSLVTGEDVATPSARSAWAVAYLVVFGSLVAYTAYQYLLRTTRPAVASSYAYVNPVVAVALGTVFADEPLTWGLGAALVLVVVSVVLITAQPAPRKGISPVTSSTTQVTASAAATT
jgi:drug/metabolite transporter (DMT)-like permease